VQDRRIRTSILLVTYRTYPELQACLRMLEEVVDPALDEVIVVDHAPDVAALHDLRSRFPLVRVLEHPENRGFGAGMNVAAQVARGDALLLMNPDTIAAPGLVDTLVNWLASHPQVAIVGPLVRSRDGRIEASARRFPGWSTVIGGRRSWLTRLWPGNPAARRNLLTGSAVAAPIEVDWVSGACLMIRRDAYAALGGFDEGFFMYWEDADLCRRAQAREWRVTYHPGASVTHLGARASMQRSRESVIAFHQSVYRYYLKHGGRARRLLAPVVYAALQVRLGLTLAGRALRRA
jgi:GT2 family glycosyltransferase